MSDIELIQGDLLARFRLDEETGRLFWITAPHTHPRLAGTEAGSPRRSHNNKIYWHVKIGGKAYKRSHIVFCMTHGRMPHPCVDHIDGNSENDRPSNIREATITQNSWNHKTRKKRSPLPMGVRVSPPNKFQARIAVNKQSIALGVFDTAAEAKSAYDAARKTYYGEFC